MPKKNQVLQNTQDNSPNNTQPNTQQCLLRIIDYNIDGLTQPCTPADWGLNADSGKPAPCQFTPKLPLILAGNCGSSLDLSWHLIKENSLPIFGSLLALSQSAGRGQLRREWISPVGNIYATWRLPLEGAMKTQGASVILGFLFCKAFASLGIDVSLKWPNDLIQNRKKVGGILLEERNGELLAGIGININSAPSAEYLRKDHALSASTLFFKKIQKNSQLDLLKLWSTLVQEAHIAYNNQVLGVENIKIYSLAQAFLAFKGEKVKISSLDTLDKTCITGQIVGLDANGSLILQGANGSNLSVNYGSPMPINY